jgi:hypothetical protein
MRRRFAAFMLFLWLVSGCAEALEKRDLIFAFGENAFATGDAAGPLLAALQDALGDPVVLEADSCLFSGKDKEFDYGPIVVGTCPAGPGGSDAIEMIMVFAPDYPASRGICVGMSREETAAAYGEGFSMDYDRMTYLPDGETGPMLVFMLDLDSDTVTCYYLYRNSY